jgi:hypothetical protein
MLSKKTYRAVIRGLDQIRKKHELDRKEKPNLTPMGWGREIRYLIESNIRSNRELFSRAKVEQTLEYLCKQGLLVKFLGDFTFPQETPLPTEAEVRANFTKTMQQMGM